MSTPPLHTSTPARVSAHPASAAQLGSAPPISMPSETETVGEPRHKPLEGEPTEPLPEYTDAAASWATVWSQLKLLPLRAWRPLIVAAVLMIFAIGAIVGKSIEQGQTLAAFETRIQQLEQQVAANQQQVAERDTKIAELETNFKITVASLQQQVATKDTKLAAAKRQEAKLNKQVASQQDMLDAQHRRIVEQEQHIGEQAEHIKRLESLNDEAPVDAGLHRVNDPTPPSGNEPPPAPLEPGSQ